MSVITGVDPNADNFVSAGIINTRTTLIGCLMRLEPNKDTKVSGQTPSTHLVESWYISSSVLPSSTSVY